MSSIYALITQRSSSQRDMPPSATSSAKPRLSTIKTNVSSIVISRPASRGPRFSTATWVLNSSIAVLEERRQGRACSGLQLIKHQVAVTQAVFLQDIADLPVGPHLRQRLRVGRAQ